MCLNEEMQQKSTGPVSLFNSEITVLNLRKRIVNHLLFWHFSTNWTVLAYKYFFNFLVFAKHSLLVFYCGPNYNSMTNKLQVQSPSCPQQFLVLFQALTAPWVAVGISTLPEKNLHFHSLEKTADPQVFYSVGNGHAEHLYALVLSILKPELRINIILRLLKLKYGRYW